MNLLEVNMEVNATQYVKVTLTDHQIMDIVKTRLLTSIGLGTAVYDTYSIDKDGNLVEIIDWGDNRGGIEVKILRIATDDDLNVLRAISVMYRHHTRKTTNTLLK
jgi:hypothetical protein